MKTINRATQAALAQAQHYYQQGQWRQAAHVCQQILMQHPNLPQALQLAGITQIQLQQPRNAITLLEKFCKKQPKNAEGWNNLAYAYSADQQWQAAVKAALKATQLNLQFADAFNLLGRVQCELGFVEEAERQFKRALKVNADFIQAWQNLAKVYCQQQRWDLAEKACQQALTLKPDYLEAQFTLGNVYRQSRRWQQAQASYLTVLAKDPLHIKALNNLTLVLITDEQLSRAEQAARTFLEQKPNSIEALTALVNILEQQERFPEALATIRQIKQCHPGSIPAAQCLDGPPTVLTNILLKEAMILLKQGHYPPAWNLYEYRLLEPNIRNIRQRAHGKPYLAGQPLKGKSILVHFEQGIGDLIQFSRFIPKLKQTGVAITFVCNRSIVSLMQTSYGQYATVISEDDQYPKTDYVTAVMSLANILNITLDNLPHATPYLHVPEQYQIDLSHLPGKKIGLTWAGNPSHRNDHNRSCPLEQLTDLLQHPNVCWISLQKGANQSELELCQQQQINTCLIDSCQDYMATAALIQQCDAVVTVDTSIAHLAGMLRQPTWVMLPYCAEWRWLQRREDSPWYPEMRLCRQTQPGDWPDLAKRLSQQLQSGLACPVF